MTNDEVLRLIRSIPEKPPGESSRVAMPPERVSLELEVIEYILGLDSLGLGLGKDAHNRRKRALLKIRPYLMRQSALLEVAAAVAKTDPKRTKQLEADAVAIDGAIAAEWSACLYDLKLMYLGSGQGLVEVTP